METTPAIAVPLRRIFSLGLIAGCIDALSYMDLQGIYAGAMTGNTVQFGLSVAQKQWHQAALVGAAIGAFFFGGVISSLTRRHLRHPALELALMAGLMLAAQMVRLWVPHPVNIELPLLAIAMAMQGETISRFGGLSIQTIVVTNNMLKCADAIVGRYLARSASGELRPTLADIVLPGSAWVAYVLGAGGGAVASAATAFPYLFPAALLIVTTLDHVVTKSDADR